MGAGTQATWAAQTLLGSMRTTEQAYEQLFRTYLTLALIIGSLVAAWLLWTLARFRAGRAGHPSPIPRPFHAERGRGAVVGTMALAITGILFATMFGTLDTVHEYETPPAGDSVEVKVEGFRFGWIFTYPQGAETLNELVVPVDHVVRLSITSRDVMHKFQLPTFRIGVDASPGLTNHIWFRSETTGTFDAWCAELCGTGHSLMRATVRVVPLAEYAAWLADRTGGGAAPWVEVVLLSAAIAPPRLEAVVGTPLHLRVTNEAQEPYDFSIDGAPNASLAPLPAGGAAWLNLTVTEDWLPAGSDTATLEYGPSNASARAAGLRGRLEVRAPRTVALRLSEWSLSADERELRVNEPVRMRITNAGKTPHDLTIGQWSENADERTIRWRSPLVKPGETADLLILPDRVGTLDAWCEVPGHSELGMHTTLEVRA